MSSVEDVLEWMMVLGKTSDAGMDTSLLVNRPASGDS